jgi:hypothetical protein
MTEQPDEERIPETVTEQDALIASKRPGWEYDLLASALIIGEQGLNTKRMDHDLRRASGAREHLDLVEAGNYLSRAFHDIAHTVQQLTSMLTPESHLRAFGPVGEHGDPIFIRHLAARVMGDYEKLLDTAAELRNQEVPDDYSRAFELAAQMVDMPLGQIHEFIIETASAADRVRAHLADSKPDPEKLSITVNIVLTVDDDLQKQFSDEMDRIRSKYSS